MTGNKQNGEEGTNTRDEKTKNKSSEPSKNLEGRKRGIIDLM